MKIEDAIEDAYPELFHKFYPRKYAAPGGYTSPKAAPCVFCVSTIGALMLKEKHGEAAMDVDPVINNVAAISERLADLWMPTYWVGKELAQAALETEPPRDLKPTDLQMPLEAMTLVLPLGTLVSPDGQDCSWVSIALAESRIGQKSLAMCTGSRQGASYMAQIKENQTLAAHDSTYSGEFHPLYGEVGELGQDDKAFSKRFIRIAVTLLMLMTARPNLVETPTRLNTPPPTTGKASRKLAAPNWIGRTYRAVRAESAGGTHASPHVHWRRGHWRHQAHGPHNSLRKDIWIEPTIIGANTQPNQKAA